MPEEYIELNTFENALSYCPLELAHLAICTATNIDNISREKYKNHMGRRQDYATTNKLAELIATVADRNRDKAKDTSSIILLSRTFETLYPGLFQTHQVSELACRLSLLAKELASVPSLSKERLVDLGEFCVELSRQIAASDSGYRHRLTG